MDAEEEKALRIELAQTKNKLLQRNQKDEEMYEIIRNLEKKLDDIVLLKESVSALSSAIIALKNDLTPNGIY